MIHRICWKIRHEVYNWHQPRLCCLTQTGWGYVCVGRIYWMLSWSLNLAIIRFFLCLIVFVSNCWIWYDLRYTSLVSVVDGCQLHTQKTSAAPAEGRCGPELDRKKADVGVEWPFWALTICMPFDFNVWPLIYSAIWLCMENPKSMHGVKSTEVLLIWWSFSLLFDSVRMADHFLQLIDRSVVNEVHTSKRFFRHAGVQKMTWTYLNNNWYFFNQIHDKGNITEPRLFLLRDPSPACAMGNQDSLFTACAASQWQPESFFACQMMRSSRGSRAFTIWYGSRLCWKLVNGHFNKENEDLNSSIFWGSYPTLTLHTWVASTKIDLLTHQEPAEVVTRWLL